MKNAEVLFCHTHSAILRTVFPEAAGIQHMDVHSVIRIHRAELPRACKMKPKLLPALWFSSELLGFSWIECECAAASRMEDKYQMTRIFHAFWKLMPGRYGHSFLCCVVAFKRETATCQPSADDLTAGQGECLTKSSGHSGKARNRRAFSKGQKVNQTKLHLINLGFL